MPPGPRFQFLQPIAYGRSPYDFYAKCRARHGDPFTVRTLAVTAVTGQPDGVQQIFAAPAEQFYVDLSDSQKRVLGAEGLTGMSGCPHRRNRKLIAPVFHGASLRALGSMMHQAAVESLERWNTGEELVMREATLKIGLDVILRTILGADGEERLETFRRAVVDFTRAVGNPVFLLSGLLRFHSNRWPPNRAVDRARGRLRDLILENIEQRRSTGTADWVDALSRLMEARFDDGSGFSDDAIIDNVITNLIAGHETSVMTLTWAFAWLGRYPEAALRLQEEIEGLGSDADIDAIQSLPFLDAVIKEVMRIYPVVPEALRMLARPMELRGWELPAGVNVSACSSLLHTNPELYPEPERFQPERFLERRFSSFEYMPFGGGDRICVGNHFGVFEVKVVLTVLLARGRYELLDTGPVRLVRRASRGFLMGPETGVRVRFERRG